MVFESANYEIWKRKIDLLPNPVDWVWSAFQIVECDSFGLHCHLKGRCTNILDLKLTRLFWRLLCQMGNRGEQFLKVLSIFRILTFKLKISWLSLSLSNFSLSIDIENFYGNVSAALTYKMSRNQISKYLYVLLDQILSTFFSIMLKNCHIRLVFLQKRCWI